jgi:acyl carrier protein phosphodiesterase
MNWLAHLLLSEPDPAYRIGNLLPDLMPMAQLARLPAEYQRGIVRHRQIDAFTDSHPVVRRSIQRIEAPYRRFGGVLMDVFYDHFLAVGWQRYSPVPLPEFLAEVYDAFDAEHEALPEEVCSWLRQIKRVDLLGSYRKIDGVADALRRMERRLKRPVQLAAAVGVLEQHYQAFQADFDEFFPCLLTNWPGP